MNMETQFKSLIQVLDYFKEESTCKQWLIAERWGNEITCAHCGHDKVYTTNRGYKCASKECGKKFSVTTGTIFEGTKLPLRLWYAAMYLCTVHKKGISSCQLSVDLNITQKTAWFVLHRIREMLTQNAPDLLSGAVEIDETFIGGADSNRHANKKKGKGRGLRPDNYDKTMVGAIERGGRLVTKHIPDRSKGSIHPFLLGTVQIGSILYSDEFHAYKGFQKIFDQRKVKHSEKEYVREDAHTNGIENSWSTLKWAITGSYRNISAKHTQRYLDEFSYRFNLRHEFGIDRFRHVFSKITNARITYKQLIQE